jgi:hypothetical protein
MQPSDYQTGVQGMSPCVDEVVATASPSERCGLPSAQSVWLPTTRNNNANHAEAAARVHGEQWLCMQRDAAHNLTKMAMHDLTLSS